MEERVRELEERLTRIERRVILWRAIATAPMAAFVAVACLSCAQTNFPSVVKAESFVLLNHEGEARATLTTVPETGTALVLMDSNGRSRTMLTIDKAGNPVFQVRYPNGELAVGLTTPGNNSAHLVLNDVDGNAKVDLLASAASEGIKPTALINALLSSASSSLGVIGPTGTEGAFLNMRAGNTEFDVEVDTATGAELLLQGPGERVVVGAKDSKAYVRGSDQRSEFSFPK